MDAVIARVMEIEKQSAMDIERAEEACRMNIEDHRRTLDEEKERTQLLIIQKENSRLSEALRTINKKTEEASLAAGKDDESLFRNPSTVDAIKGRIVAILLEG